MQVNTVVELYIYKDRELQNSPDVRNQGLAIREAGVTFCRRLLGGDSIDTTRGEFRRCGSRDRK
jgi:hypothetical protein